MTRLRKHRPQPLDQMIDVANRLAPYVAVDTDPKSGVRLQAVVVDAGTEVPATPMAVAV